jgi:hypothetical protein
LSQTDNPYAATSTEAPLAADNPVQTEEERTRRKYLCREAMIRSLGFLYYFSAAWLAVALFTAVRQTGMPAGFVLEFAPRVFWFYVFLGFLLVVVLLAGWGLRRLAPWARVPVAFFSTLGLLSFPAGTGVNLVVLYLVFSPAGWTIFSPEYRGVIERTPQIHYRRLKLILIWCGFVAWVALLGAAAWALR